MTEIRVRGLPPGLSQLRARARRGGVDGPWTSVVALEVGYVPVALPPGQPSFAAVIDPFLPVGLGGTAESVPDLAAISVTVSRATGPRPLAVAFQLVSADPNFYAFAMFGTAKWTFSQHASENYAFRSLTGRLAGDTAGTAFGPYVGHVYETGPAKVGGIAVSAPLAHEWSVTLSYPGLPDRTITFADGGTDRLTGLAFNEINVHDDDWWFCAKDGQKTKWWAPAAVYPTAQAFYEAMADLENDVPGSSGVYDWTSRTVADFSVDAPTTLTEGMNSLYSAKSNIRKPVFDGGRILIRAGTTYVGGDGPDHQWRFQNLRTDRFGPGLDPVLDYSGILTGDRQAVILHELGAETMNLKLVGPYDAANPGTGAKPQYQLQGIIAKESSDRNYDRVYYRLDISGFNVGCNAVLGGHYHVVMADCHITNWYNYGFYQQMNCGATVGCRVAQNPNAQMLGRRYHDAGGGNFNMTHLGQDFYTQHFDWSQLAVGGLVPKSGAPAIPPGYEPPASGVWGEHPAGAEAWKWWTWNWDSFSGWDSRAKIGSDNRPPNASAFTHGYDDLYAKCAIHGPTRLASAGERWAFHQCELESWNGWSPLNYNATLVHPVTGSADLAQTSPTAFAIQPTARLWTDGNPPGLPEHSGASLWRVTSDGGTLGFVMQTGGSWPKMLDSVLPHAGIIVDGCIATAGIRIATGRTAVRNSLVVMADDTLRANSLEGLGPDNSTGITSAGVVQTPMYFYNSTVVFAGNAPNASAVTLIVTSPAEEKRRRSVEWNNARFFAGTGPVPSDGPVPTYTNTTSATPTEGAKTYSYAPAAGSNMLGASAVALQPKYDLEGAVRPATAAVGAFEML